MKGYLGRKKITCYKKIHIKVVIGKKAWAKSLHSDEGQSFSPEDIEDKINAFEKMVHERLPKLEFRKVRLLINAVNFIAAGLKKGEGDNQSDCLALAEIHLGELKS